MVTSTIRGRTRGGEEWEPRFVTNLDQQRCIGCGRCFKVCPRDVYELVERELGDDEDEDDTTVKVMRIANQLDCIGCQACAKVCPKSCHTHEPACVGS